MSILRSTTESEVCDYLPKGHCNAKREEIYNIMRLCDEQANVRQIAKLVKVTLSDYLATKVSQNDACGLCPP